MTFPDSTFIVTAWTSFGLLCLGARLISPRNKLPGRGLARLPICSFPQAPILQVELGRTEEGLVQIFNPAGTSKETLTSNCQNARIGNVLDTLLFIPAYTTLLISVGLLLSRATHSTTVRLTAMIAVPLAAICDWAENFGIANTLEHFRVSGGPHEGDAKRISNPSIVKWGLLSLIFLINGAFAFGTKDTPWVVIGLLCLAFGLWIGRILVKYLRSL